MQICDALLELIQVAFDICMLILGIITWACPHLILFISVNMNIPNENKSIYNGLLRSLDSIFYNLGDSCFAKVNIYNIEEATCSWTYSKK